jgi:hypothetical protein
MVMNNYADFAKAVKRLSQLEPAHNGNFTTGTKWGWSWNEHKVRLTLAALMTEWSRQWLRNEDNTPCPAF